VKTNAPAAKRHGWEKVTRSISPEMVPSQDTHSKPSLKLNLRHDLHEGLEIFFLSSAGMDPGAQRAAGEPTMPPPQNQRYDTPTENRLSMPRVAQAKM
jgi:hypothetical protein